MGTQSKGTAKNTRKRRGRGSEEAPSRGGRDRKQDIIDALYRCMGKQGYAASTLSDVATEAGMSSSHLLYYFSGKEAILEAFFRKASQETKRQLEELPEDPKARLEAIGEEFLPPGKGDKTRRAVMLDLHGQCAQNRTLRRLKASQDRLLKKELVSIFKHLPRASGMSAEDAASSAHAMLQGLQTTSFFDSSLSPSEAHRLFRLSLYRLGGIKAPRARKRR